MCIRMCLLGMGIFMIFKRTAYHTYCTGNNWLCRYSRRWWSAIFGWMMYHSKWTHHFHDSIEHNGLATIDRDSHIHPSHALVRPAAIFDWLAHGMCAIDHYFQQDWVSIRWRHLFPFRGHCRCQKTSAAFWWWLISFSLTSQFNVLTITRIADEF